MNKALVISLLTATLAINARSKSAWHTSFKQEMQQMEKAFDSMVKRMNAFDKELDQTLSQENNSDLGITIEEKDKKSVVIITIKNLKTDALEANLNDDNDQLKVKTDQDSLTLAAQEKFLSLVHTKETKKEEKKNDKAALYTSFGAYELGQLLSGRIDLTKADIQYDKKSQTLTISMPYLDKKKEIKKIPVVINNK